jgi:hypothetical protein
MFDHVRFPDAGARSVAVGAQLARLGAGREPSWTCGAFGLGLETWERAMDVDSTAISEIDYDAARAKLLVRFMSGERYVYVGVPGEVHRSFCDASSKGRFFQREIRDRYPYNRLDS